MDMSIIVSCRVSPDSWYVTGYMPCNSYSVPYIAVVCRILHSLALTTDPQYLTLLLICCKHWAVITDLHIPFNEFDTHTAHTNKRSVVWSCRCIHLINKHAYLHSSPDARTTLTFCLIICYSLLSGTITSALLCSATIWVKERCWLTERASGVSELFKTLAAIWIVNIQLWTDWQICKANQGICHLAQSATLQSALNIDFIMLKFSAEGITLSGLDFMIKLAS